MYTAKRDEVTESLNIRASVVDKTVQLMPAISARWVAVWAVLNNFGKRPVDADLIRENICKPIDVLFLFRQY